MGPRLCLRPHRAVRVSAHARSRAGLNALLAAASVALSRRASAETPAPPRRSPSARPTRRRSRRSSGRLRQHGHGGRVGPPVRAPARQRRLRLRPHPGLYLLATLAGSLLYARGAARCRPADPRRRRGRRWRWPRCCRRSRPIRACRRARFAAAPTVPAARSILVVVLAVAPLSVLLGSSHPAAGPLVGGPSRRAGTAGPHGSAACRPPVRVPAASAIGERGALSRPRGRRRPRRADRATAGLEGDGGHDGDRGRRDGGDARGGITFPMPASGEDSTATVIVRGRGMDRGPAERPQHDRPDADHGVDGEPSARFLGCPPSGGS